MKASEIKVGGEYMAKVGGKVVPVRVNSIEDHEGRTYNTTLGTKRTVKGRTTYHVTSLVTHRKTTFRSAQKFRSVVGAKKVRQVVKPLDLTPTPNEDARAETMSQMEKVVRDAEGFEYTQPLDTSHRVDVSGMLADKEQAEKEVAETGPQRPTTPLDQDSLFRQKFPTLAAKAQAEAAKRLCKCPTPNVNPMAKSRGDLLCSTCGLKIDPQRLTEGKQGPDPTTPTKSETPGSVTPSRRTGSKTTKTPVARIAIVPLAQSNPFDTPPVSVLGTQTLRSSSAKPNMTSPPKPTKMPLTEFAQRLPQQSPEDRAYIESRQTKSREFMAGVKQVPVTPSKFSSLLSKQASSTSAPHMVVRAYAGTGKTFTQIVGVAWAFGFQVWDKVCAKLGFEPTPSPEQQAVWEAMAMSRGQVKTITYTAFNKSIVTEFNEKWAWLVELLRTVGVSLNFATINSIGNRVCSAAYGNLEVTDWHVENMLAEHLQMDGKELKKAMPVVAKAVPELVGLCKLTLAGWDEKSGFQVERITEDVLDEIASHYEIEMEHHRKRCYDLVPEMLTRSLHPTTTREMDYNDQNWLPVVHRLPVPKVDLLLVDEGQDLPRCKQEFARMMGKRILLVGDVRQAIYGFAGADVDSIPRMEELLNQDARFEAEGKAFVPRGGCLKLRLTETRRCGKAIVREAQRVVPDFKAHESNGEGEVKRMTMDSYAQDVLDKDMVLCRVNAPLISQALRFIKAGRKAIVRGRDFGRQLMDFVRKFEASDPTDLIQRVDTWLHNELKKEKAKKKPSDDRIIALQDRHLCVLAFTEGAVTVQDVLDKMDLVFAGKQCPKCRKHFQEFMDECRTCKCKLVKPDGVLFSSIHKAKGLEAERVYFLQPKGAECPHPMAKSDWQIAQEWNCWYIAVTRAIDMLCHVS